MTQTDLIDHLLGSQLASPLAELRARRPDVARYTQGSYDALLQPADSGGVTLAERALIALRVATVNGSTALREHYRQQLQELRVPMETVTAVEQFPDQTTLTDREVALLRHTDLLTKEPSAATAAELHALEAHNLSARDLVTIGQLIAFLSFQVRVLAGLQLFQEGV